MFSAEEPINLTSSYPRTARLLQLAPVISCELPVARFTATTSTHFYTTTIAWQHLLCHVLQGGDLAGTVGHYVVTHWVEQSKSGTVCVLVSSSCAKGKFIVKKSFDRLGAHC